ncbi:MAG: hypothetical protein HPY66_3196 [Firmicutes bacterium]|nr:hypothetical protein [Bacillota bacterium]
MKRKTNTVRQAMADKARERMITRHDGRTTYQTTAEEARKRMIARHDGTAAEDTQKAIADSMRTVTDEEYRAAIEGQDIETTLDEMFRRAYKDIYGGSRAQEKPARQQQRTADEAMAAMIERMSGNCPDRIPGSK